jgi:hypothetical protein
VDALNPLVLDEAMRCDLPVVRMNNRQARIVRMLLVSGPSLFRRDGASVPKGIRWGRWKYSCYWQSCVIEGLGTRGGAKTRVGSTSFPGFRL